MYREIKQEELKTHKTLGYVYFMDKDHPLKTTNGFVYYHRHIASIKEGRWLTSDEHVHHIDKDKSNNNPANLAVVNAKEHANLHMGALPTVICPVCHTVFKASTSKSKYCSEKCSSDGSVRLKGLTTQELEYLIWTVPFTRLAIQLKCSDNGVRSWATRLGCTLPPTRFHTRFLTLEKKLEQYKLFKET